MYLAKKRLAVHVVIPVVPSSMSVRLSNIVLLWRAA